jgi:predicted metalloendopeptidase
MAAAAATAIKPENGAWGVDLSSMDTRITPRDDFVSYVNRKWVERTEIPADRVEAGGLAKLQDKALAQMRAILAEAAADAGAIKGSDRRKMGAWHRLGQVPRRCRRRRAARGQPLHPLVDLRQACEGRADARREHCGPGRPRGRLRRLPVLAGRPAPVLEGYTGDQRFFMAYAQAWRWKARAAAGAQLMRTGPHPPSAERIHLW